MKKKNCIKIIIFITVIILISCGGGNINTVKNGVLNINQTTTIGKALEKNPLIGNGKWEQYEGPNGAEIVKYSKQLDFIGIKNISNTYFQNRMGNITVPEGLVESTILNIVFMTLYIRGESDEFTLTDSNGLPVTGDIIYKAYRLTDDFVNKLSSSNYVPPDFDPGFPRFTKGSASIYFSMNAIDKTSFSVELMETVFVFSIPSLDIEDYVFTWYSVSDDKIVNIYNGGWW